MNYHLSKRSMKELVGVHPILSFAITEAIKITKQDFMVLDGVRSTKEQEKLVARGVSKTLDSYHLYGLAADLVAYVDGSPSWNESYYRDIADAMKTIISRYKLPIEWGYDKWKWDMAHWQITKLDNVDARTRYDIRKLA